MYFSYKSWQLFYLPVILFMKISFGDKLCLFFIGLLWCSCKNLFMQGRNTLELSGPADREGATS